MFAPRTNCGISATARSETARLRNKLFKVADMDDAFHSARITRRFPRVAPTENVKFKTLETNIHVPLKCASVIYSFNLRLQS